MHSGFSLAILLNRCLDATPLTNVFEVYAGRTYLRHKYGRVQFGMVNPPVRRLNVRIRKLCTLAAGATEDNIAEILWDLQAALHEHAAKTCEMATRQVAHRKHRTVRKTSDGISIQ